MNHKPIGTATINGAVTTIREYDNGAYTVEVDGNVIYSGFSLKELEDKLKENNVTYSIS